MKIFSRAIILCVTLIGIGCASAPTNILEGTQRRSKISLQFQDFPEGTVCEVVTPKGSVVSPAFPGAVEYPAEFRDSPVTCTTPDEVVYDVLMTTVLPETFKVAGLTAYIDGLLIATIAADSLIQTKNEEGVAKRP